jgi:hypothetical protein
MLKKSVWLLGLLAFSTPLLAQRKEKESFNFVRMSLLATDMNRNLVGGTGIPQVKPGFAFGMGRNFLITKGINIQPGLEYTPRGYRSRRNLTDSTFRRSWVGLHYLDFALTLGLSFGGYTKFYVDAAPYVGYGIYGKNKVTRRELRTRLDTLGKPIPNPSGGFLLANATTTEKIDPFKNDLKRWDYGYRVSIGLRRNNTTVGLSYSEGLADLNRRETFFVRNRAFGLFLTYLFDDMF